MTKKPDDLDADERDALAGLDAQLAAIRARHHGDPPLDLLRAARHDVLPAPLQEQVSDHLRDDAWSRALVEGLDGEGAGLDAEGERRLLRRIERESGQAVPGGAGRRTWWRYALAGGGLVAATLAVMLRPDATPSPGPVGPASPRATSAPAPPAATATTSAGTTPAATTLAFEKAEVTLSLASMTWRGGPADRNPMLLAFKPAFDAYRAGDYTRAAAEFARLARAYPEAVEPPFYQGVSLMLTGDFAGAVTPLSAAARSADATFAADAAWYLSAAEVPLGRIAEARARLQGLCRDRGDARACAALPGLPSR